MAFPYIYPYAYSQPDPTGLQGLGWIHSPDPSNHLSNVASTAYDPNNVYANSLNRLNHAPLDAGDSLPAPQLPQTWWGFPTWRETMSNNWQDPFLNLAIGDRPQKTGLAPVPADTVGFALPTSAFNSQFLPPMDGSVFTDGVSLRLVPQPFNDGAGLLNVASGFASEPLWVQCWEDDLILTGVRSFDVKAYDNSFPGYVDLGWGDDGRNSAPYYSASIDTLIQNWTPPLIGSLGGNNLFTGPFYWPPTQTVTGYNQLTLYSATLAHEGRMPPVVNDNRFDAQTGQVNIGIDTANTIRLRRVWDTWSTDYTNAPSSGVNPSTGQPLGVPFGHPVYPSFPAPYPMPLRGIQIQIRVVDPRNEKTKVLTIRQDFSDKL
jgi:hypothetical protein